MPGRRGHWDLREIRQWKESRQHDPSGGHHNGNGHPTSPRERKTLADARQSEARAAILEQKRQLAEGELLRRDDVEQELAGVVSYIRTQLEQLPDAVIVEFEKDDRNRIHRAAVSVVNRCLTRLASGLPIVDGSLSEEQG
jgi:hypothetical protein